MHLTTLIVQVSFSDWITWCDFHTVHLQKQESFGNFFQLTGLFYQNSIDQFHCNSLPTINSKNSSLCITNYTASVNSTLRKMIAACFWMILRLLCPKIIANKSYADSCAYFWQQQNYNQIRRALGRKKFFFHSFFLNIILYRGCISYKLRAHGPTIS